MNTSIQDFVSGKRIALAGASRSGKKFGNIAGKELKTRGYQVYLVHPEAREIDGEPCTTRRMPGCATSGCSRAPRRRSCSIWARSWV
jgi:predicted CoA-binding protein